MFLYINKVDIYYITMGNIFKNIFKRNASKVSVETSNGTVPKSVSSELTQFVSPLTFGMRSNIAALKLSAVYAAMSLISNAIATLPIYVKQHKDDADTIGHCLRHIGDYLSSIISDVTIHDYLLKRLK